MAPLPTVAKLPVKFDAGLLKIKDFIEPFAQLRAHPKLKLEKAKLKTHELEFPLSTKGQEGQEPETIRIILTRRCDLDDKFFEKIAKLAEIHNSKNCCLYIILGNVPPNDPRADLLAFDARLMALKPYPIQAMAFKDIAQMAASIENMHLMYKDIRERVEEFWNDVPGAYRKFFNMAVPDIPIPEEVIERLLQVCPTINDLVATMRDHDGRNVIRAVAGRYPGDKLIAFLKRGSL
ncbi:hypothetical protein F5X68DRAFT_189859 [Plectosphaerella plurivora]|uniref:Uncharacterized protein n=1 Tax=Plectosphaerella plurivora TaxID=936078 RepID=A0A9P9ADY9_9PEZI|nr:hypothetical protein F5X68DRAFT_189859 [Plectosphaerella plurivora]